MIRGHFYTSMDDMTFLNELRAASGFPMDRFDHLCVYAVSMTEEGIPTGFGRLYVDDDSRFRMDDIFVAPAARGQRLSDLIIRMLLYRAQDFSAATVRLTCDDKMRDIFYLYGFRLEEKGGDGNHMVIRGEDIELDSCEKCKKCEQ